MEQLIVVKKVSKCCFCGSKKNDDLIYGPMYKLGDIIAHYYCVLLSNRLIQNGNDNEGLLGFLLSDIKNELQRTSNVLCIYCHKGNATIQCAASKCKRSFHFPCGLKNGSSHQFANQFKSYCHCHKLIQNIPAKIFKEACKSNVICCICQEKVNVREKQNSLWAPCCLKTWYHRKCIQKFAHSAGYFCRCAACNDSKKFNKWMQTYGIFIPQQDASWEMVPNAFEELLFRYSKCDARQCKCPGGRQKNKENTMWEIALCQCCGSQGIHVACGNLKFINPEWECPGCQKITKKIKSTSEVSSNSGNADEGSSKQLKSFGVGRKKRLRSSEDFENYVLDKRKKRKSNLEEDDIEIDVETVHEEEKNDETVDSVDDCTDVEEAEETKAILETDQQNVFKILKPGPFSYKVTTIRKIWRDLLRPRKKTPEKITDGTPKPEVIVLSDSEETEEDSDSDIEVIEKVTFGKGTAERHIHGPQYGGVSGRECEEGGEKLSVDFKMSQQSIVALEKYEVTAFVSFQLAKSPESSLPGKGVVEEMGNVSKEMKTYLAQGYLLDYSEENPSNETVLRNEKEILQTVDDDVIILTE